MGNAETRTTAKLGGHYDTPQGVQCSRETKNEKMMHKVLTLC